MSRLANRIRNAGLSQGRSIGFAAAGRRKRRPLVVVAPAQTVAEVTAAVKAGADAVSFEGDAAALAGAVEAAGDTPIGVVIEAADREQVQAAADAGADFFIFDDARTSPGAIRVEEIGRIVILGADQSEDAVRLLAGLSLDAVLIDGAAAPTVRAQLALRQLTTWAGAPLLVASESTATDELAALRDAGAGAVLARGDLAATLTAADAVPPPRRASTQAQPLIPTQHPAEHDHGDEDF